MSVLSTERQEYILEQLEKEDRILVANLAKSLGVTPETIRRDLDILEKEKKLKRVHGGAVKYHQTNNEPHFEKKMNLNYDAKVAIGNKAAEYIQDGDTVMIDVGTTNIHLANAIRAVRGVTIVTNSLAAAEVLNNRLENKEFEGKVIVLGGVTNPAQKSIVGALTCKMLKDFRFDKVFLSCGGVTAEGVTDYDLEESNVSTAMIERANQVFLMADSSKLGYESFYRICSISTIDYMICDQDMPSKWREQQLDTMLQWIIAKDV
ncbi:DeoR/GlpR family DNA-binding transcription regulator [Paenibacillus sediminis]|uniref:DeoR/GlpR family transcriptional regulator of sugar metabolism n=1 Tax=Paenibacillus sediminis TaxID=664909 RepID=A0ABS4H2U7_9BACL|nr:DeoR/GlpR family DNA-binding transcription regulator [Paenibacillus sediminis]MBP1936833.1 DeoR/GlpR family transcriptional regulator of sugar metabolism [Paenibacillus sediminis]